MYHIPYETIIIITYENICLVSWSHPNLINIHLGISFPLKLHQEYLMTGAEIIDPVFAKTSPQRSFSKTEYERFVLVFTKTRVYKFGHSTEIKKSKTYSGVPRVQVKRRPSAAGFLPAPTQMALCLRLAYIDF